jgi:hypothetical protein
MGVASDSMERRNCRLKEFQHCCLVLARRIYGGGTFEAKKAKAYQMHTFRHEREQKLRSMTILLQYARKQIIRKPSNKKVVTRVTLSSLAVRSVTKLDETTTKLQIEAIKVDQNKKIEERKLEARRRGITSNV